MPEGLYILPMFIFFFLLSIYLYELHTKSNKQINATYMQKFFENIATANSKDEKHK